VAALAGLSQRLEGSEFRHWGDADAGGLRIWWFLRGRLGRPVSLFRTTAEWVSSQIARGGRRLSAAEAEALERLKLQVSKVSGQDTFTACELIDKLLVHQIRIEQERF
jgi:hypothetical protein